MRREMDAAVTERIAMARLPCADRVGLAKLTTMAATGIDLRPLWHALIAKLIDGTIEAGEGLDLSLIAQLLGDKEAGLAIQHEILKSHQLFRSKCSVQKPPLRVLALAAATDMGSNTPIEFLLKNPAVELMTLYVIPEVELPLPLPEHDIAIVIASDSEDCRDALRMIDEVVANWPRPLLNPPHRVCNLDRDKLHGLLTDIEGLEIPATIAVTRTQLSDLSGKATALRDIAGDLAFPLIVRPRGSHAGKGLAKIDDVSALETYLREQQAQEFFVSRFVDYSGDDGLFRKFRIVIVDGKPYACHLAVADRWDIWYLNAGMTQSASKRLEEETFMRTFDIGFARRHATALAGMIDRIGLDYFMVDCAETKDGSLLIFEADNTAIVHDMDPPDIFPYKAPQMRKVFDAFAAMLERRARHAREQAA
jgi:glutathione synthase/RimK-type ligase-like ATP-grasp enzyme